MQAARTLAIAVKRSRLVCTRTGAELRSFDKRVLVNQFIVTTIMIVRVCVCVSVSLSYQCCTRRICLAGR